MSDTIIISLLDKTAFSTLMSASDFVKSGEDRMLGVPLNPAAKPVLLEDYE